MVNEYRILIGGFGGQGILLAGKILADACIRKGYKVSWMPSYGPEMRGGTCNCRVVISEKEVINPIFSKPDVALILNDDSAVRFSPLVKKGGTIISNLSLVNKKSINNDDSKIEEIRASEISKELGNASITNIVMIGRLLKTVKFLKLEDIEKSLANKFSNQILEDNIKALIAGYNNSL